MGFMDNFRASMANLRLQRFLRTLEFLSPIISIGFFAARLHKIAKLEHRLSSSNGAVAGILAAGTQPFVCNAMVLQLTVLAIIYSLITMLLSYFLRSGPKILRWIIMVMDILFVGAFIAVAYLTRPHGGTSGPCTNTSRIYRGIIGHHQNCSLPWGTFIMAIISA